MNQQFSLIMNVRKIPNWKAQARGITKLQGER